jgi:hypothetical protein
MILSVQNSDDAFYMVGSENLSGFDLRRARGTFRGMVGDTSYKISGEISSGTMALRDAYLGWECGEILDVTFGRYKNPLLWSGRVSSFADPFHDVPVTAAENDGRGEGVMVEGTMGAFDLLLSVQNGSDGLASEQLLVGRAQWNMIGENAFGKWHGAYGYGDGMQLSAAVGFFDDGAIDNGSGISGEVGFVVDAFSLRADMVDYDENYDETTGVDLDDTIGTVKTNTTPSAITFGYLFGDDAWEILVRQEDFDDAAETDRSSIGLVWYSALGPKGRWALLYQELSSDDPSLEGTRVELSFALGT